ncbi:hypothetical protein EHQ12_18495 [Leptospira gomenensis]|uniref:Outer membrane protein beta-barrel domain-containing protein n=1 Tax=Leptospira gomenensis TaxID=2484974 RepID=A0A5F1YEU2_9LEPT|nr:hypothetical protein [Leptospira gomenensis]TGK32595.1 hypothetical protein EHQ12_18495 [Leptospira gomenensis]TGK38326.1 hypothetical protein EHQ17_01370 [Leptospira gomenensis]TGK52140.1 hypothetical protein EHQ07_00795 [Leptospira gomenensis]
MKKEYFILLICSVLSATPAVSTYADANKDTTYSQFAPWTLKAGGGIGRAQETNFGENKGKTNVYRLSAEYNPRYFGFEFGVTRSYFKMDFEPKDRHIEEYAVAQYLGSGTFLRETVFRGDFSQQTIEARDRFDLTFLDLGPTFHFRPGRTFDPYLSIGAGTTGFDARASYRGFGRLGLRLNFDRFYVFTEAEGSAINRYNARDIRTHYNEYSGMVGVGFYFGGNGPAEVKPEQPDSVNAEEKRNVSEEIKETSSEETKTITTEKEKETEAEEETKLPTEEKKEPPAPMNEEKPL